MHSILPRCDACTVRYRGICGALGQEERAQLLKLSRRKAISGHQVIFRDGDEADHYFNIVSGVVKLVKTLADGHQHIIGLLYPPDFMGQSLNKYHTYSAEAATEVELCAFPKSTFDAFVKTHAELERQIFHTTLRELDLCRDWTLLLGRKCSYERVAGFLLMMATRIPQTDVQRAQQDAKNSVHFELPFTRAEIADYLGLTLETVSRQFSHLKKKNLIGLPSSRDITIPDIELLSAVAQIEHCSHGFDEGQGAAAGEG